MKIKIYKLRKISRLDWSIIILIWLVCVPITQCFPGIIRKALQVISIMFFVIDLTMKKKIKCIFVYLFSIFFWGMYVYGVWRYNQSVYTCYFNVMAIIQFCMYPFVTEGKVNEYERIIKLTTFLVLVTSITTIIGILKYPMVVRELGRATSYDSSLVDFEAIRWSYRLQNIAGWSQIYGMVFFLPILTKIYYYTRNKIYLVTAVLSGICVVMGQITFAVLLSILLFFFTSITLARRKYQIIGLLINLGLVIYGLLNFQLLIKYALELVRKTKFDMLSTKINDLYLLSQRNVSGDARARFMLYRKSFDVFRNNMILGYFLTGRSTYRVFSYHSDFFDLLGYFGLVGTTIAVVYVICYIKYINQYIYQRKEAYALLTGLVLLFIFNPVWYSPQIFLFSITFFLLFDYCIANMKLKADLDL